MKKAEDLRGILKVTKPKPLRGEEYNSFFIDTYSARGEDAASMLSDYFLSNCDSPQKVLFMGHRGSGKSTELYRMEKMLDDDFKIINFSIREEIDTTDLEYSDLIFVILERLYEAAKKDEIEIDKNILDNLDQYWNSETIKEELLISKKDIEGKAEIKGGLWGLFSSSIKGVFKTGAETKKTIREFIRPQLNKLIQNTNDLISNISDKYRNNDKSLLLIIEDLDKLDIEIAENLFLHRRNILTGLNIHIIYTFPIFLLYSEKFNTISEAFDHHQMLSMIKTNNRDGTAYNKGRETLRELVDKRIQPGLIEQQALDFIIEKSGGAIRHLLEMLLNATLLERSQNRDAETITLNSAQKAYSKIRSYFERCIESKHITALKELYEGKDGKPLQDDSLKEMLSCLAVIEYNGDRWCGLHPAVKDYLKNKGVIE